MSRRKENTGFLCESCGSFVLPLSNGSYRNHCPVCLYSRHVDVFPGDRKSLCRGLMEPVGVKYKSGKGYQLIHECLFCGHESVNKIAENTVQPDDIDELVKIF